MFVLNTEAGSMLMHKIHWHISTMAASCKVWMVYCWLNMGSWVWISYIYVCMLPFYACPSSGFATVHLSATRSLQYVRKQDSGREEKRIAFSWVITQQVVVIYYRPFGTTSSSHLQGSRIKESLLPHYGINIGKSVSFLLDSWNLKLVVPKRR